MFPATFEIILTLIGPALNATGTAIGRKPISAEKQLLIALWFMATPDSYRYVKISCFHALNLYTLFLFSAYVIIIITVISFVTIFSFFILWFIVDLFASNLEWAMQQHLEA